MPRRPRCGYPQQILLTTRDTHPGISWTDGHESPVEKTSVEIDDRLITEAKRLLKTSSIKDTIDGALRELVQREARRQEIRALTTTDCLDLRDESVMAKAWRR